VLPAGDSRLGPIADIGIVKRAGSVRILYKVLIANAIMLGFVATIGTWFTYRLVSDDPDSRLYPFGIGTLIVGVLMSLVVNYLVLRAAFKPLEALEATTQAVREGDMEARVRLSTLNDPQITQLAETFNATLDQLALDRDQVRYLASQVVRAQEDERKRISRELHDDTAQLLFAQLLRFTTLKNHPSHDMQLLAESLEQSTVEALEGVRRLALELRPPALDDLGLYEALGELSQRMADSRGVEVDYEWRGSKSRLQAEIELALYRVAQEAFSNIAKHSGAASASLDIDRTAQDVTISIRDAGRGFNRDLPFVRDDSGIGLGLFGMEERVALVGGSLRIWSGVGKGTEVFAYVPLNPLPAPQTFKDRS
jgi:two-component system sensor histidine kinase UhpB